MSERMYRRRITAWGLSKNMKLDEVRAIVQAKSQRSAPNQKCELWKNGKKVAAPKLARYLRRNAGKLIEATDRHLEHELSSQNPILVLSDSTIAISPLAPVPVSALRLIDAERGT
jgi:hypothetical protein